MGDVETVVEVQERQEREKLTVTIAELKQQLEAARKDAARLRAHIKESVDEQHLLSAMASLAGDRRSSACAKERAGRHLAALQPKEPPMHVLTAEEWAKWKALYAAMHLGTEHVRRFQMGSTADIALDAIDGGIFNAELTT